MRDEMLTFSPAAALVSCSLMKPRPGLIMWLNSISIIVIIIVVIIIVVIIIVVIICLMVLVINNALPGSMYKVLRSSSE